MMKRFLVIFIYLFALGVPSFAQKKDTIKFVLDHRSSKPNPEKPVLIIINGAVYYNEISTINPDSIVAYSIIAHPFAWEKYGVAAFNGVITLTLKTNNSNKIDTSNVTAWDIFNDGYHNPVYIINKMIIDEKLSKQTINTLDKNKVVDLNIKKNQSSAQRTSIIITTKQ